MLRPVVVRPPAGTRIVQFNGVTRSYGSRLALEDVSFGLEAGELTFLVGPSGAGKTTLLKLINREIRPTTGEVWIDGLAAHDLKASHVAQLRRRVGVVFQDYKLLPRLTARENVALALQGATSASPMRRRTSARSTPSKRSASGTAGTRCRTSCPVGSSSEWPWRAPSSASPHC